jgi:hypothetical protein
LGQGTWDRLWGVTGDLEPATLVLRRCIHVLAHSEEIERVLCADVRVVV